MYPFLASRQKSSVDSQEAFVVVDRPLYATKDPVPEPFQLPKHNGLDLFEVTIDELQYHFSSGSLTILEYTKFCLEAIRKANPYLECVIETNPDALDDAKKLDMERKDGKSKGPLYGIPVLIKDNIATADRMETTGGSWALLGCKVPKDAHIVHLLRKAGAVIIGKSNLDEWAGMRSHKYSCGYSARGGQTRNPYRLNRSPNGSSSGSAVAVSSNLVPLAFGTETDCSIISPAAVNGVAAIKPTVGLTSRGGVIPISETQDSVGPFGRTIADCALALDAIAGLDPDDKFSTVPERRQVKSYFSCLTDRHALEGARFGVPMKRFWECAPQPQRRVIERVLKLIAQAGAEIRVVDMPCAEERLAEDGEWDWERYGDTKPGISEITVSAIQTCYLMEEYLSKLKNTSIRTLADIVAYNNENRGTEGGHPYDMPAFPDGQPLFRQCVETKGIRNDTYYAALRHIQSQCREYGIDAALKHKDSATGKETQLDALLFCDVKRGGIQIAAQAGYPVLTIPAGLDSDGMPVSLVLIHTAWQDDKLVKWASAIENLLAHHNKQRTKQYQQGYGKDKIVPREKRLGRIPPTYKEHLRKNIPVVRSYRYEGVSNETDEPWPDRKADPDPEREGVEDGRSSDLGPRAKYIDAELEECGRAEYLV